MYHHLAANVTTPETVTNATRFYDLLIDNASLADSDTAGRRRTKELLLSWYHTLTTKALCEFLQCATGEYGLISGHSLWVISLILMRYLIENRCNSKNPIQPTSPQCAIIVQSFQRALVT
jgi:hypothetical protein